MNYRIALLLLAVALSGGCRACSNCYDYSSPVSFGPNSRSQSRAGSTFATATTQAVRPTVVEPEPTDIILAAYHQHEGPAPATQPTPTAGASSQVVLATAEEQLTSETANRIDSEKPAVQALPPLFAQ